MTLSCSHDVNVSIRKENQEVLGTNNLKGNLSFNKTQIKSNTGMEKGGDFHLQLYASSPAPKRDYHGLTISNSEIILNSWDISRGTHVYPRRKRISLDDFLIDKWLRSEIEFLFGSHVIIYIDRLAKRDRSIFCLSEKIVRKIIDYLAVNDILHLKQSSKIFFELCNTNEIWKILFRKIQKRPPSDAEIKQAELGLTWCHILQTRVRDIHERKTIYQNYKKGVEALHRKNHEIGDRIRNTVKKQSSDKWKRTTGMEIEKISANQIKIPTYHETVNININVNKDEKIKPTTTTTTVMTVGKKTDVKLNPSQQSILKKRVETKKTIETINEMKKVTFSQPPKSVNGGAKMVKIKSAELKLNTKTTTTTTKCSKNNENLKSKTFIA